ncbi:MAG: tetratricopeptide repeat protein [Thermodesulfobacteriota bacterium]
MKNVYIVKSSQPELDELEKKKRTETKAYYLLKESEVVIVRYSDCIYDFVEKKSGLFYVVGEDKSFFQTVRTTLHVDLGLSGELVRSANSVQQAVREIEDLARQGRRPAILMERVVRGESTARVLKWLRQTYRDFPVIILSMEVSAAGLAQYHEAGASNFITKPVSANVLVEKLAFTLEPQSEFQALVRQGKDHLEHNEFEEARDTAQLILDRKPNSAAGYMILGDALRSLARREEALRAYKAAEEGADMYLEPLKRILDFYAEENDEAGQLEYLRKLDKVSPNHLERKLSLGKLLLKGGQAEDARQHIAAAMEMAAKEGPDRLSAVGQEIAEQYLGVDPALSEEFFRSSIQAGRTSQEGLKPLVYNRLGLALRRQGKWREAVKEYLEAEKLSPRDENIQFNIAMALAEGEDWEGAADRLDRALEINPRLHHGHKTVCYNMGAIYTRANRQDRARPVLEHLNEIAPGFRGVDKVLDRMGEE